MAVLSANNPTLLDVATRSDPSGKIAAIVEILNETNEVLADMSWVEGNLPTGHKTTIRSGLPTPTWRKMYGGVQPTKSTTVQVIDNCGMLEMYAEIDKALADLNGNTAAFRLSEERAFIEGLNQEVADTLFYGNEGTEPEAFTGFSPRFNLLAADSGDNIIKAGTTPDTSIWLIVWGPNVHGIIPKGSTAGMSVRDLGEVTVEDASDGSNTGRMQAYRTHYRWDVGLTVRDWRYVVRIQFDLSELTNVFASGLFGSAGDPNLPDLMFQAMRRVPSLSNGRPAFYMSRDVASWVARQKAAMGLSSYATEETVAGTKRWTEMFNGIPIRRVDALATAETEIS